jgi:carboxymethylenebutenolidase
LPEIQSQYVELQVSDGSTMRAWLASPLREQAKPGLIVFQEAFGVNHHIRALTDRFAEAGFAAIAPELYHRSAPGFDGSYSDVPAGMAQAKLTTVEGLQADIRAAYDFLRERAGEVVASTGYCMGGRVSFLANATVPLRASVSYYGGGLADVVGRAGDCSAPMLFFWGGLDKHITAEHRKKVEEGMQASKHPSVQVTFSDAEHAFFCDERPAYNPTAAKLSWDMTMSFFEQYLGK